MSFCSFTKGITPNICWFCLVLINRVLLNLLCVWSKQQDVHSNITTQTQGACIITVFENNTDMWFVYATMLLRQSVGLSKEACFYAGADWLKLICQSVGGWNSVVAVKNIKGSKTTTLIRTKHNMRIYQALNKVVI